MQALFTVFAGLKKGATYEFDVATSSRSKGQSKPAIAKAALPPSYLDARPGPPERFRAVSASDASAHLTWDAPAGNPRVDGFIINVRETNSTGWPLPGADKSAPPAVRVKAGDRSAVVKGLRPGAYWAFIIQVGAAAASFRLW